MIKRLIQLLLFGIPFICLSMESDNSVPKNVIDLLTISEHNRISNDSVFYYLKQRPDDGENAIYIKLYEGEISGTPIMIYKELKGFSVKIYMCVNPYDKRYPSTLLLWSYDDNRRHKCWFEIDGDVIRAFKICDYDELIYIACEDFKLIDGKFRKVDAQEAELISREDYD